MKSAKALKAKCGLTLESMQSLVQKDIGSTTGHGLPHHAYLILALNLHNGTPYHELQRCVASRFPANKKPCFCIHQPDITSNQGSYGAPGWLELVGNSSP